MDVNVEQEYRARIDAMSVAERVLRAEALFNWSREYLVRAIVATRGPISDDELKWELALRLYGSRPETRALIAEARGRARR